MATTNSESSIVTHRNEQYTITTSLSDHHIIINLTNNVSYACYEGRFANHIFGLSLDNSTIFQLINKCFAEFVNPSASVKPSHTVIIIRSNQIDEENRLISKFHCNMEGDANVKFEVHLIEKIHDNLTLTIESNRQNQMITNLMERITEMDTRAKEQQQTIEYLVGRMSEMDKREKEQQRTIDLLITRLTNAERMLSGTKIECEKIPEMERKVEESNSKIKELETTIGFAEIEMTQGSVDVGCGVQPTAYHFPINTKTLLLDGSRNNISNEVLNKIQYFYKLETLWLRNCNCYSIHSRGGGFMSMPQGVIGTDLTPQTSLSGCFTKLVLVGCHRHFNDLSFLSRLPNLRELTMIQCMVSPNAVSILRSIKHYVKKFTFERKFDNEPSFNVADMTRYCEQNGIELVIK